MKHILTRLEYLTEGAKLTPDRKNVILNWENSFDDGELLKTSKAVDNAKVEGHREKAKLYYGLFIDNAKVMKKDKTSDTAANLKLISDHLKSSNIEGGFESLKEFVEKGISKISMRMPNKTIDYVVPLGSTKQLSSDLAKIALEVTSNGKRLPFDKIEYDSIYHAIDWEYVLDWDDRVARGVNRPIVKTLKGIVKKEIANVDQNKTKALRGIRTGQDLKTFIEKGDPSHSTYDPDYHIDWISDKYVVRSSGTSTGGSRTFFKHKYNFPSADSPSPNESTEVIDRTDRLDVTDMISDCIYNNKSILMLDDNMHSRTDLFSIIDRIYDIADSLLDEKPSTDKTVNKWKDRIASYVLIDLDRYNLATDDTVEAWKQKQEENDISNNI